jgi:hypothetical protein
VGGEGSLERRPIGARVATSRQAEAVADVNGGDHQAAIRLADDLAVGLGGQATVDRRESARLDREPIMIDQAAGDGRDKVFERAGVLNVGVRRRERRRMRVGDPGGDAETDLAVEGKYGCPQPLAKAIEGQRVRVQSPTSGCGEISVPAARISYARGEDTGCGKAPR